MKQIFLAEDKKISDDFDIIVDPFVRIFYKNEKKNKQIFKKIVSHIIKE